jgi:hypothetical protein
MRRPKRNTSRQATPAELVTQLLNVVRSQFYGDLPPKRFFQDRNLLLRNVILYPAHWLDERGVTLPSHRYQGIVLDVLQTIKRHGDTRGVQYLPGYLAHCLQTHFKHHGEEYYEEAKALRSLTGDVINALAKLPCRAESDLIPTLAALRADLAPRKRRRTKDSSDDQPSLFGDAL